MMPHYAYVLRLWSENRPDGQAVWRIALLDPRSGNRLGFGSPADLVAHLEALTGKGEADLGQTPAAESAGDF